MRMWGVPPWMLCRQHLSGEHVEMHMFVGSINKGTSLDGYIEGGQVEVHNIIARHEVLEIEGRARGYNYDSPLPDCDFWVAGSVDVEASIAELMRRCHYCEQRILNMKPGTIQR